MARSTRELSLTLDNYSPQSSFVAGSTLRGHLTVEAEAPRDYKQITICLVGTGAVSWHEQKDSRYYSLRGTESWVSGLHEGIQTVKYSGSEVYTNVQQVVWKSDDSPDGCLPVGRHIYPFQLVIPATCPSSYQSNTGNISYVIQGIILSGQLQAGATYIVRLPINVLERVAIDTDATRFPVHSERRKTINSLCCKSGDIVFSAHLPRTGFYVGEEIPVSFCVENGSDKALTVKSVLLEQFVFKGQLVNGELSQNMASGFLAQLSPQHIQPHTTSGEVSLSLPIPNIRPAIKGSNIISSNFAVKVVLEMCGSIGSYPLIIVFPISIGNANTLTTS